MPQTAAAAEAFWSGGGGRAREGAVQHTRHTFRVGTASAPTEKSLPATKDNILFVGFEKMGGARGREEVMCALRVTDHYFFTFPKKFLFQIFTSQSQLLSSARSLTLKLPLPCKCIK